jgi:hypothetical protein
MQYTKPLKLKALLIALTKSVALNISKIFKTAFYMFNKLKAVPPWALLLGAGVIAYIVFKPDSAGKSIGGVVGNVIFDGVGGLIEGVSTAAGRKLSPTSTDNYIYDDLIGGLGRGATGNKSWSLGTQIYDLTH